MMKMYSNLLLCCYCIDHGITREIIDRVYIELEENNKTKYSREKILSKNYIYSLKIKR